MPVYIDVWECLYMCVQIFNLQITLKSYRWEEYYGELWLFFSLWFLYFMILTKWDVSFLLEIKTQGNKG